MMYSARGRYGSLRKTTPDQSNQPCSHSELVLIDYRSVGFIVARMSDAKQTTAQKSAKIAAGAVVCVESEIRGDVSIGARTVVHPKARIIAEAGPIIIGEGNLIEEQALIINSYPENILPDTEGVHILNDSATVSQALKIGDNNVIESKGKNVILTSGCIIGACCQVNTCEAVPENTVVYGSNCLRRVQSEKPQPQTLQLDFLMKILPNYHHLKKTVKGNSTPNTSGTDNDPHTLYVSSCI
ncbi:hypothetical protein FQN60_006144 [Etheostoma spectabile]|uniref:Dynactin subunit 6 n=1 Tax=Etheostoma spectabile TaxID=54343 RepID=A0A5J5CNU2_9PERO|nr:hypothetical protein FQN60_006144 [Etheostoma spectabile]